MKKPTQKRREPDVASVSTPLNPREWSPDEHATFALSALHVVQNLLCNGDDIHAECAEAAGQLLIMVEDFLDTLDLRATAKECQKVAAEKAKQFEEWKASRK